MAARETIKEIIALDIKTTQLKEKFDAYPQPEQETTLIEFFEQMLGELGEDDPLSIGLIRIAEMLLSHGSQTVTVTLSKGLGHANPDARLLSGDALLHLAEDGLDHIMPAVDDALKEGGLQAEEMTFLLTDVDHPEVPSVLLKFLAQESIEIVASAIEALAEFGDPSTIPELEKLVKDERLVPIEGDAKQTTLTLGELAKEAIEMLKDES